MRLAQPMHVKTIYWKQILMKMEFWHWCMHQHIRRSQIDLDKSITKIHYCNAPNSIRDAVSIDRTHPSIVTLNTHYMDDVIQVRFDVRPSQSNTHFSIFISCLVDCTTQTQTNFANSAFKSHVILSRLCRISVYCFYCLCNNRATAVFVLNCKKFIFIIKCNHFHWNFTC